MLSRHVPLSFPNPEFFLRAFNKCQPIFKAATARFMVEFPGLSLDPLDTSQGAPPTPILVHDHPNLNTDKAMDKLSRLACFAFHNAIYKAFSDVTGKSTQYYLIGVTDY